MGIVWVVLLLLAIFFFSSFALFAVVVRYRTSRSTRAGSLYAFFRVVNFFFGAQLRFLSFFRLCGMQCLSVWKFNRIARECTFSAWPLENVYKIFVDRSNVKNVVIFFPGTIIFRCIHWNGLLCAVKLLT